MEDTTVTSENQSPALLDSVDHWGAFSELIRWSGIPLAELEGRAAAGDLDTARLKTAWRVVRTMPQMRQRWHDEGLDAPIIEALAKREAENSTEDIQDHQEALSMARNAVKWSGSTLEDLRAEAADGRHFSSARNRMAWMVVQDFLHLGYSDQV